MQFNDFATKSRGTLTFNKNTVNGSTVYNFKSGKSAIKFLSPKKMFMYGAREGQTADGSPSGKYSMSIPLPNATSSYASDDATALREQIQEFYELVIDFCIANSLEWFGKEIKNREVMMEKVNSPIKYPKVKGTQQLDYSADPFLSVKIQQTTNYKTKVKEWQPIVYIKTQRDPTDEEDPEGTYYDTSEPIKIPKEDKPDGTIKTGNATAIVQFGGLWIVNGVGNLVFVLDQIIMYDGENGDVNINSLVDEDGDNHRSLKTVDDVSADVIEDDTPPPARQQVAKEVVEIVDDDEPVVVEAKPTPPPVQETKSKRTRK
jgi:hypothetical protein